MSDYRHGLKQGKIEATRNIYEALEIALSDVLERRSTWWTLDEFRQLLQPGSGAALTKDQHLAQEIAVAFSVERAALGPDTLCEFLKIDKARLAVMRKAFA